MKLVVWLAILSCISCSPAPTPSAEARRQLKSNKEDLMRALRLLLLDVEQNIEEEREVGIHRKEDGRHERQDGRLDGRHEREGGKHGKRGRRIQAIREGRQNEFGAEELTETDRERFGIGQSESQVRFSTLEECEPTGFETRIREACEEVSEIECSTKNVTKFRSEIFERCKTEIDKSCKVTMTEIPKQECKTGREEKRCKTEYNIVEEKIYNEECNIVIKNICEENVKVPVDNYHKPVPHPHHEPSKHYQDPHPHHDSYLQHSHPPHTTPIPNHVPDVHSYPHPYTLPSPHSSRHISPSSSPHITPLAVQFNGHLRRKRREVMEEETLQFNEGQFQSTRTKSRSPLISNSGNPAVHHDHPQNYPEIPHVTSNYIHHDGKSTISTHELPAPYGCRSIATKECYKVPIVVPKKIPYESCINVPTVNCFLVLKEVAELECSPEVHVDCNDFEKKVPFLVQEEECEEVFFDECQEIEERVPVELCKNIRVDQESITIVRGRTIRKEGEKRRRKTTQRAIQKGTQFINSTVLDPQT